MKKPIPKSVKQSGRRRSDGERHRGPNIVFGTYLKKDGKEIVVAKNTEYPVVEIKYNVPQPIAQNAQVKALLRAAEHQKHQSAIILRAFSPKLTLKALVSRVIEEALIPVDFSAAALKEAKAFGGKPTAKDKKNRFDLTALALCTIDGESAKDFDDAVFAKRSGKNIEVTVAIADVSHYVKALSSLDEDAALRGTSIYYPGHCIPMLPESLSNGLCSLKPETDRLAIAVIFEVGPKGAIFKTRIKEAIINSKARLTYNQVEEYLTKQSNHLTLSKQLGDSLKLLQQAAHALRKVREKRGAIDFDLVESVVALDDRGEPLSIHPQDRLDSHRIIEDLMVATNEIVADLFDRKGIACLYRVHEPPDQEKLDNFFKTAKVFGALDSSVKSKASSITEPKTLQEIMTNYQDSKYKETLNNLMLRSMMQARYSEQNLMHFGLASTAYLHFTSPIRRYADLIVHRQLRTVVFRKEHKKKILEDSMAHIAESISQKEVKATEIERKIDRLYSATFMASHIGENFDAVIVSCTEFGFFVRIIEHHVEGLVHIATISRSRVNFIPERLCLVVSGTNEQFMVGDKVLVKLINVNVERGHVDFELVREEKKRNWDGKTNKERAARKARLGFSEGSKRRTYSKHKGSVANLRPAKSKSSAEE